MIGTMDGLAIMQMAELSGGPADGQVVMLPASVLDVVLKQPGNVYGIGAYHRSHDISERDFTVWYWEAAP